MFGIKLGGLVGCVLPSSLPPPRALISMRLSGGGVVLAFLHLILTGLVVASTSSSDGKRCAEPEVRREWRALSATEKAEFISAVKVIPDDASSLETLSQPERSVWQKFRTGNMSSPTPAT